MSVSYPSTVTTSADADAVPTEEGKSVNLYELLGLAPNANTATVRKRITELFLEAQNNLDHRNFRRRFYYQELFEVHLPRAREHLLDEDKRSAYDRSLTAHASSSVSYLNKSRDKFLNETLPSMRDDDAGRGADEPDMERLPSVEDKVARQARLREANLAATEALRKAHASTPADKRATVESMARFHAAQNQDITQDRINEPTEASQNPIVAHYDPNFTPARFDESELEQLRQERRRDFKRRELIKNELIAIGWQWAIMSALGTLLLGIVFWFCASRILGNDNVWLNIVGVGGCCLSAALVGRIAHREARRRTITLLSKMPYEHLLHRCAHR